MDRLTSPSTAVSSLGNLGMGRNMDMCDPATVGTASASHGRVSRMDALQ